MPGTAAKEVLPGQLLVNSSACAEQKGYFLRILHNSSKHPPFAILRVFKASDLPP